MGLFLQVMLAKINPFPKMLQKEILMSFTITLEILLMALAIFLLRIGDMSLDTIRMLFVIRGRKALAWGLGFGQSLLFVVAISSVLTNLNNPVTILAYAAGFATGNVVGMLIEERMAIGYLQFTIISSNRGAAIAEQLRKSGYAVTEIPARGRNGTVTMLQTNVKRKDMDNIETIVLEADPEAFITLDEVRPVRRGYWRA
jgi:uncharacterized protein YebE (UPF0316 family)